MSTGTASKAIAVNPTQNIVYVTQADNTLTYVDSWNNTVHKISDPGAANTNGASASSTYLNGVFVANSISNDIAVYYVAATDGYTFQQLLKDPHAVRPLAMASNPNDFGSLYVANEGSNTVSVFVNNDPDYAVSPTSPFGTNCSTAMLVGNPPMATNPPIFCQFEFDITTGYDPNKRVDTAISGRTRQFNDVVIAFPPANVGNLTVTTTPATGTVIVGQPLSIVITVSSSTGGAVTGATLSDPYPLT